MHWFRVLKTERLILISWKYSGVLLFISVFEMTAT